MGKRIILLCLIGMLAGFSTPAAPKSDRQKIEEANRARATLTRYRIHVLRTALKLYRLDTGNYPGAGQGLAALIGKPDGDDGPARWRGPYLNATKIPGDGWGNPFLYTLEGGDFEIVSLGADGKKGGKGIDADISSKNF